MQLNLKKQLFKKLDKNIAKSICPFEKNMCTHQDFKLRLAIEKRRAERSSCKASIIFFSLKKLVNGKANPGKIKLEDVTKLVCSTIRITDIGMLYKKEAILLLLPDTGNYGAECLCKRIIKNMTTRYAAVKKLTQDDFNIKILSFPEHEVETIDLERTIIDKNDTELAEILTDDVLQQSMQFKKDFHNNLNLCVSSLNGSVISMSLDDIFFWDLELVSKYLLVAKKSLKKIMDVVGSIAALLFFMPLMLVIAVGIKFSSPGPILFKQKRVGYKGKHFTFLKFRSMVCENEDTIHQEYVKKLINGENEEINNGTEDDPCYKIENDPRTTPFGRFIRKTSMDELPQFFNVLKGEMSLVGPRPPTVYEVKEYKYWHRRRVLQVKPGLTGLWQVSGRNRLSFAEMVRMDIQYAENWSIKMDLKILFKTIFVVFDADGK